jgi:hypothetical protein
VGHAFFHPDNALEPHGEGGWLMVREEGVLGAVVREGNGYYKVFVKRDGMAAPLFGKFSTRPAAAVALWNATHPVRWGDVS